MRRSVAAISAVAVCQWLIARARRGGARRDGRVAFAGQHATLHAGATMQALLLSH